jgi:hypothetical protein
MTDGGSPSVGGVDPPLRKAAWTLCEMQRKRFGITLLPTKDSNRSSNFDYGKVTALIVFLTTERFVTHH